MNWTYSIKNKFVASAILLALCLLVLLSHYLDRMHTKHVTNSIATLYEDRLIAEDYILKMTRNVYQIREVIHSDLNDSSKSNAVNKQINEFANWYNAYIKTKLTATEKTTAIELIGYIKNVGIQSANNTSNLSDDTEKVLLSLNKLSAVQLEESKLIMQNAESEYATIKASSQFAFAIIIVILLVLQAIVFSAKTLMPVNNSKGSMLN